MAEASAYAKTVNLLSCLVITCFVDFQLLICFAGLQFQSNPGIVTCLDNNPHKLETGQFVTFREINGMSCLNGSMHQITGKPFLP